MFLETCFTSSDPEPAGPAPMREGPPVVGILGAGQLGRMLALAAVRLGIEVRFTSPRPSEVTEGLGTTVVTATSAEPSLREFVRGCDVITIENEWAPCDAVARIAAELGAACGRAIPCHPSPTSVASIADKLTQKRRLERCELPLGRYRGCATLAEAEAVADELGWPLVVKRRRGAYDGYGNRTVRDHNELRDAWALLAEHDGALLEAWVPFVRELAVIVARRPGGETAVYPVAHTEQTGHRCAAVVVPAPVSTTVAERARELARAAVEAFEVVGVCAVELFELADGRLWINELAPRPHNSGHYSIEACHTSQFENHLRAILDLPLGDPSLRVPAAVMLNILGPASARRPYPELDGALAFADVSIHLYNKRAPRPGRKLGHLTVTGDDPARLRRRARQAVEALRW